MLLCLCLNMNAPCGEIASINRCLILKERLTFTKEKAFIVIAHNVYSPTPSLWYVLICV